MKYPSAESLMALGRLYRQTMTHEEIDNLTGNL